MNSDPFQLWYEALERRYMADLTFQELRRAVQALSATYVEQRGTRIERALATAGKRAAFAMFYAPLHFLTVRAILRELPTGSRLPETVIDLGCGTGVAGAAWAAEIGGPVHLIGIERHAWAAGEARWTYRKMKLPGRVEQSDVTRRPLDEPGSRIMAAFTINELERRARETLQRRLMAAHQGGASVLVIEPLSRRAAPWWNEWTEEFTKAGGRADQWRFPAALPAPLKLMDKAAGLDHAELTGRSLWLPA